MRPLLDLPVPLGSFLRLLHELTDAVPGLSPYFDAPPPRLAQLCVSVLRNEDSGLRRRPRTLTSNQAATLIGWLCFTGETDHRVSIIGRNQSRGTELCQQADRIARDFLLALSRGAETPARRDAVYKTLLDNLFERPATKRKIMPRFGPSVLVWSRTSRATLTGIIVAESRASLKAFKFPPVLCVRYRV